MRIDELRATLHEEAHDLGGADPIGPQARTAAVAERVRAGSARRHTARVAGVVVAAVVTVAGFVLGPTLVPGPAPELVGPEEPMVQGPPRLAGFPMPPKLTVADAEYSFVRERAGRPEPGDSPRRGRTQPTTARSLAWATSFGSLGRVVVSVDGEVVDRPLPAPSSTALRSHPARPTWSSYASPSRYPAGRWGWRSTDR